MVLSTSHHELYLSLLHGHLPPHLEGLLRPYLSPPQLIRGGLWHQAQHLLGGGVQEGDPLARLGLFELPVDEIRYLLGAAAAR